MKSCYFIFLILFKLCAADNKSNLRRILDTTEPDRGAFHPHETSSSLILSNHTLLEQMSQVTDGPVKKPLRQDDTFPLFTKSIPYVKPATLDIVCNADSVVMDCGLRGNDIGLFVCRSHGIQNITYTTCVSSEAGHVGDICGCCGRVCPVMCSCGCGDVIGSDGSVLGPGVWIERASDGSRKKCVTSLDSLTRQLSQRYTCGSCGWWKSRGVIIRIFTMWLIFG